MKEMPVGGGLYVVQPCDWLIDSIIGELVTAHSTEENGLAKYTTLCGGRSVHLPNRLVEPASPEQRMDYLIGRDV
jgi:hypothetical protein